MKFIKKVSAIILLCFACFLCACQTDIGINLNGGTTELDVEKSSVYEFLDSVPQKEGFIFGGWYSDREMIHLVTADTDLKGVKNLYAKWITADTKTYNVRSEIATITDSGRAKQKMDVVFLSDDYDYQGLLFAGYKRLEITCTLDVRELDDGYQYVFLYSDTNCVEKSVSNFIDTNIFGEDASDPSLLCGYQFEHVPGDKGSDWGRYNFTVTINISDMKDDLYIRYGASGSWDDDWQNTNITITVNPK